MPGNAEEKEKCLEKLNQMQKFLPFIDFMIDKIKKKSNEVSLEGQLSKFQVLRSMIAEKSGKYSWDVVIKVEEVIEKLITKLDFKDQYDKSKDSLANAGNQNFKTSSSGKVPPSATAAAAKATSSQKTGANVKGHEVPTNAVDLIMKTLKVSVDSSVNKNTDKGKELLSNSLGPNQPLDVSGKAMETDLDKDLDGFDLTDCHNFSESESSNSAVEPVNAAPEKVPSHDDLLSSSREKLLKSLQSRLLPSKADQGSSRPSAVGKTEKGSESQSTSAFGRGQTNSSDRKSGSEFSENSEHGAGGDKSSRKAVDVAGGTPGKPNAGPSRSTKSFSLGDRTRCESGSSLGDPNLKQRLKEKFSTDICEVYRVPGRSVGGSLRSLKEPVTQKKSCNAGEEELFRPDVVTEVRGSVSQSRSGQKKDGQSGRKSHQDLSAAGEEKKNAKTEKNSCNKWSSTNVEKDEKTEKRQESKSCKNSESKPPKSDKSQESKSSKEGKKPSLKKDSEEKNFEVNKLNDDELLEFVKENMQYLPHLAKLKPDELRKAVQSSGLGNLSALEADSVSEISDDSFHDLDESGDSGSKGTSQSKCKKNFNSPVSTKHPHPLASVKIAQVGSDGVAKNVKPIIEPSKDTVVLDEIGDKTHDMNEVCEEDNLDEEDYALKLIEETTPSVASTKKKKKGLLELPLPILDDLFDDISSIESFETLYSPNETRDPRLRASEKKNVNKNRSEPGLQGNADSCKVTSGPRPVSNTRANPPPAKDNSSRPQPAFGAPIASTDSYKAQRSSQNRPDPWPSKPLPGHSTQDVNQYPQLSGRFSNESADFTARNSGTYSKPSANPSYGNSRRHSYGSTEPKSYAEYKRMKQKVQEKLSQQETTCKENPKSNSAENPDMSRSPAEREDGTGSGPKKLADPRVSRSKDSYSKQANPKSYQSSSTYDDRRRSLHSGQRRFSDHVDHRSREERKSHEEAGREIDRSGKIGEEKRHSAESEELVSPLEELYRNQSKPKTGRGYGIQNFKIPKKVREYVSPSSKSNENQTAAFSHGGTSNEADTHFSTGADVAKESKEQAAVQPNEVEKVAGGTNSSVTRDISAKSTKKVEISKTLTKTDSSIMESDSKSCEAAESDGAQAKAKGSEVKNETAKPASESVTIESTTSDIIERGEELGKVDSKERLNPGDAEKETVTKSEPKTLAETGRKCEAQIAECDSSVSEQGPGNELAQSEEKSSTKEDSKFSQEFVEALIRKSFQSGEGKLLLAHAKLFEEFARKLNSKKLKTIQKIINSETDSSSSSGEMLSEDEKKKKKGKKSEDKSQKSRRGRKRGRKNKKHKSLSSCSSSESENSEEENCDKKEDANGSKQSDGPEAGDNEGSKIQERDEELESKNVESLPAKANARVKKRRRNAEFGKHFSGRKAKRKQQQKKLLEKIMNETPEASQEANPSSTGENPPKGTEPKARTRTKGKVKTELDRLHDDIRNMFLNAGVVTPTGQRMCRILRQSGGNINNMDIVKESAKMVEEEKLKKANGRSSAKNARVGQTDGSDGKSQPVDRTSKNQTDNENETDPKLATEPRVVLQRVDLNNFGYGVKISEDCISFMRMQGRNTAIRGIGSRGMHSDRNETEEDVARNVFLARNKRKVERLEASPRKKGYFGKRLSDVVKNLPLKMAKMKHLQICEKKGEDESVKKRKYSRKFPKRQNRKSKADSDFTNAELLNYAFERIRVMYSCKLCSHVTRYITGHYKMLHPEHEVLISRLCVGEAKRAKLDAKRNRYDNPPSEENPLAESMKRKMKILLNIPSMYNCRMCSSVKTMDLEVFKAHVSSHTGEFRFECPAEGCNTQTYSQQDIKIHVLTKHPKNRVEYSKVNELYSIAVEGSKMFGFLCSVCNFVQLCRANVASHISRRHAAEKANIIKINMSANALKPVKKRCISIKTEAKVTFPEYTAGSGEGTNVEKFRERIAEGGGKVAETNGESIAETKVFAGKKRKKRRQSPEKAESQSEDENRVEMPEIKKVFVVEGANEGNEEEEEEEGENEENEGDEKGTNKSGNPLHEEEMEVDFAEPGEGDNPCNEIDPEDCVDFNEISALKGSDILGSLESQEKRADRETLEADLKLKVGPLEARLLGNSAVLYECYVKGCLFYTRAFDLFEKHIKISHSKTKWNGVCGICTPGKDVQSCKENSFELLTALRHLKLHEREKSSHGRFSSEDLINELKLLNSTKECVVDGEDADRIEMHGENPNGTGEEGSQEMKKTDSAETPFPAKPLLRVRNLLGDRLSTPKESPEENDVVAITEEPVAPEAPPNSMFTIEDVRSLNDSPPEDSEIQIQHVCSLKDSSTPLQQLAPGKTILVRSCPTRKIAIRPEPSSLSIDVGQLSVVQAPTATHPVVLAPLTTASPIRIISSSLSPKSKFTVKPILVPADSGRVSNANVLSLIRPALTPVVTSPPLSAETNCVPEAPGLCDSSPAGQIVGGSKPSLDVTVIPASNKPTPPSKPSTPGKSASPNVSTSAAASSTSLVEVEDGEEKDSITLQRIHSSPNVGNKRVKDAKIYEEMLTKTKLCHLFKCMGIECSFTCNNECVFRQHIGLHDAQRRLKNNKGIRTIFLRLANKTTRAFYWQQCAYCCELLTNTNKALSQHVLEEHGHCMYQCAFCFYRAVSHSYVEIHQNLAHSQILKTTPRVIYKCKPLRKPPTQNAALEKHGRRQSVRPYHCDQCGRKFFITQDFINHLTTQHQSVTAYTCHICKNLCFKADRLVVHYKLHSYCTYQCAYCLHGTETEKEMVFHLCNFHFSQPAVMYVRAFADGQNHDVKERQMTKKKHLSNQLESLKVVVYESDTLNADCIVEVDPDEDAPENVSESSTDLSSIVAELGINAEVQSSPCVTPLMKELASIGDKSTKNLTVKTLLPNAQFSSEIENGAENCSILISSGLSTPSDQSNEKAMNIPLGQLPLEVVNVQRNEATPPSSQPKNIASPDKNLKLNEIIVNLQNKDKIVALPGCEEGKQSAGVVSSAIHKLPPVVLSRSSASKNVYPSKSAIKKRKSEETPQGSFDGRDGESGSKSTRESKEGEESRRDNARDGTISEDSLESVDTSCKRASAGKDQDSVKNSGELPPNGNAGILSNDGSDKKENAEADSSPLVISDICSLSSKEDSGSSGILINIQSKINSPTVLKPPIIRVEDFPIGEGGDKVETQEASQNNENEKKEEEKGGKKPDEVRSASPDIIILEQEKSKSIITVTLDSDDERNENSKEKPQKNSESERKVGEPGDHKIRKEMELLREQIASETDSLLFDETEGDKGKENLSLSIEPASVDSTSQSLLSPIEEAICSLNKKLQSETEEAQKKQKKKEGGDETPKKPESCVSEVPERPRTRFSSRDRRKEGGELSEKTEGDESNIKKEELGKGKKMKEGLVGKDLFICGNENCNFAAEDDLSLKDHLYVCDLSRETSVLVCPHCSRQTKQFHPYLEHLKYHGQKKYHCGLCEFSSAVDASVSRHLKQKHKCSFVKSLPKDSQPGHLMFYPKNYKVEKTDFEVNGYSPGDEDKLPLQSVYQVNVKCAKCPYFTKVRSNMVRHLKIHVKSVETEGVVVVPSTAPTNPVPCLETKERMFDKMTNLAASSQLAQAKEKSAIESLSPEDEAKLPQFVAEQMRYKCCLPDCNYITVDDGMLKHHIKALHDEINYYSCPHCQNTVHVDVRHVTLDKIGHHLKHHDAKLYKCAHCIYFHYQKNVVEKHTVEKHPDRRYFVHTVREPKPEATSEEEASSNEGGARVWKCGLCDSFRSPSKPALMDHLVKNHNIKSKYRCKLCTMKGNNYHSFFNHFASKHPGEKVSYTAVYLSEKVPTGSLESGNSSGADSSSEHFDTTPLWQRGTPRIRHIRGILIEEEEIKTKKSKRGSLDENEAETGECAVVKENAFCCPLCTNKKKPFYTRSEDCFRTHLYQELNYQQFACILCGKMFVDRKDFDKHHARSHPDKAPAVKQTKEDHEIKFWVDQVIAKRRKQMEDRKRKLSDGEASGSQGPVKKKKEV